MKKTIWAKLAFLTVLTAFSFIEGMSCSMYKITFGGKTMVGCNEDAWRLTPHIWFENARNADEKGAAFTGSRWDGADGYAPQSGMNTSGLCYSRLASRTPENSDSVAANRKPITHPTLYLKDILHTCTTVEEVQAYIGQYDHRYFMEDVFIYIDTTGKYLIVEPFTMTIGHDPNYVLTNFCPSVTPETEAMKIARYRNGTALLKSKTDTTLRFCTQMSDTMHVCRPKIGDGTLLTSIWDLRNGTVYLYFYHQYKNVVQFNLKDELAKGDHSLEVQSLFPPNPEFAQLAAYKIPQNSKVLMFLLMGFGGLFLFSSFYFLIGILRGKSLGNFRYIQGMLVPLGIVLLYYMFQLCTNMGIFYFAAPYQDAQNPLVGILSYLPFLLTLLIVPFILLNVRVWRERTWTTFSKYLLALNNVAYVVCLGLFVYWGFFDVFG